MEGLVLALAFLFIPLAAWGSPRLARGLGAGQHIRPEGPSTHGSKAGTPTMGGIVPLGLVALGTVLLLFLGTRLPGGPVFVLLSLGAGAAVGLLDDLRSQRGRRSVGFFPHQTLLLQLLLGGLLALAAGSLLKVRLAVPFSARILEVPAYAWVPLAVLGFVGTVNGVNLSDGLDGLATGLFLLALLGLLPLLRGTGLVPISLLALGAGLGFLWANAHPASVFLGNVGAMGLGGLLFGLAFASGGILFLPLVGGVFVLEALAVILQVGSYKLTGVRLLKMAPLHHHLEDVPVSWPHRIRSPNWPEPKVVVRLWILGAGFAVLGALGAIL